MNYGVCFLIISRSLSSGSHLTSYDRKGPSNDLDETCESFDLLLKVYEDLLICSVFGFERME